MSYLYFRTTLLRSNPQVVRVFAIRDDVTVSKLLDSILLIHSWETSVPIRLYYQNVEMDSNNLISDYFASGLSLFEMKEGSWFVCAPNRGEAMESFDPEATQDCWIFRLEKLEEDALAGLLVEEVQEAAEENPPRILSFFGYHPDYQLRPGLESNGFFARLEQKIRGVQDGWYNPMREEEISPFLVKVEVINRKLAGSKRRKTDGRVTITWRQTLSFRQMLESMTVDAMKGIIRNNSLGIPYNIRKAQLVEELYQYFLLPAALEKVLEQCPLDEYLRLKELVTSGQGNYLAHTKYFPCLSSYGFCSEDIWRDFYLSREFLAFFEDFLNETGDKELIEQKKVRKALEVCARLYGVFPKEALESVCQAVFSGEISQEIIDACWKVNRELHYVDPLSTHGRELAGTPYEDGVMYLGEAFALYEVVPFLQKIEKLPYSYYVPNREDADEIWNTGMCFQPQTKKQLTELLQNFPRRYYYASKNIDDVLLDLYLICQCGLTQQKVERYFEHAYYLRPGKEQIRKIWEILKGEIPEIHSFLRKGHTESSMLNEIAGPSCWKGGQND